MENPANGVHHDGVAVAGSAVKLDDGDVLGILLTHVARLPLDAPCFTRRRPHVIAVFVELDSHLRGSTRFFIERVLRVESALPVCVDPHAPGDDVAD